MVSRLPATPRGAPGDFMGQRNTMLLLLRMAQRSRVSGTIEELFIMWMLAFRGRFTYEYMYMKLIVERRSFELYFLSNELVSSCYCSMLFSHFVMDLVIDSIFLYSILPEFHLAVIM